MTDLCIEYIFLVWFFRFSGLICLFLRDNVTNIGVGFLDKSVILLITDQILSPNNMYLSPNC
jgi:hypothetical protein